MLCAVPVWGAFGIDLPGGPAGRPGERHKALSAPSNFVMMYCNPEALCLMQAAVAGRTCALVEQSLLDVALMKCRPSVVAAAVLYADRRRRGVIPFWPVMLAKLTGYADMGSPELSAAIKAALRLAGHPAVSGCGGAWTTPCWPELSTP